MNIIDVLNLTPEHKSFFVHLIRYLVTQKKNIILMGEKYKVSADLFFQHNNNIIIADNTVDPAVEAIHFYVTSKQPLGNGANGEVFSIDAHFCLTPDGELQQQAVTQALVVKLAKTVLSSHEHSALWAESYRLEVNNIRRMHHLGFVTSALERRTQQLVSAIVMTRQPGVELYDIIAKMLGLDYVSSQFKFQLTMALLEAYQQQLSDLSLIHGDIKPENIIVDLGMPVDSLGEHSDNKILPDFVPPKLDCAYIDVARAKPYRTPFNRWIPFGSPSYVSPELYAARINKACASSIFECEKIDIYSFGRLLMFLWKFNEVWDFFCDQNETAVGGCFLKDYDRHNDSLSWIMYLDVLNYISEMSHMDQIDRPTISGALNFFGTLQVMNNTKMSEILELQRSQDLLVGAGTPSVLMNSPIAVADMGTPELNPAIPSPLVFSGVAFDHAANDAATDESVCSLGVGI